MKSNVHFFVLRIADTYLKHPNSYLPKYNVNSETDGETTPLNANDPNRNSGGSNVFESEEELDDQIDEEGRYFNLICVCKTPISLALKLKLFFHKMRR